MSRATSSGQVAFRIGRIARTLAGAGALSLLAGCFPMTTVPALNPTPNIALLSQSESLDVAFGPDVGNALALTPALEIDDWRGTLGNGFRNGFRAAFPPKREGSVADMTLRIDQARGELASGWDGRFRIQYAASLLGHDGTVLRRASGIASRRGAVVPEPATATEEIGTMSGDTPASPVRPPNAVRPDADVSASIDAMYEQLAKELFPCAAGEASCPAGPRT